MKRVLSIALLCMITLASFAALADSGAPDSQFGFKGWPYRDGEDCAPASCALGCSQCRNDQDCAICPFCQAVRCTAKPAAEATPKPTQTPQPAATIRPTAQPTNRSTTRPTTAPTAKPSASTGDYTTISVTAQEQKILNLLNQDRANNGLPSLTLDAELSRIARFKSCDMNEKGYFAHESPTYGNAAAMLKAFGYPYNGVGENIAHHATVEKAEAAFMSSSGHRTNILGSQWTKVGIGVCVDKNGFVYVTQLFVR